MFGTNPHIETKSSRCIRDDCFAIVLLGGVVLGGQISWFVLNAQLAADFTGAVGIWAGAAMMASGVLGIFAMKTRSMSLFVAKLNLAVISAVLALAVLMVSIRLAVFCKNPETKEACQPSYALTVAVCLLDFGAFFGLVLSMVDAVLVALAVHRSWKANEQHVSIAHPEHSK